MATLLDLVRARELSKLLPGLEPDEQEFRMLYAAPRFEKWVVETLPTLNSQHNLDVTPQQQLEDFFINYALDRPLTYRWQFRPIKHHGDAVWELKTADVRVFGWFYRKDQFIALIGDEKWRVKEYALIPGYANEVVQFRDNLDLEIPKFVLGKDPNDVISNFVAPP
jgi:hypothetical protein